MTAIASQETWLPVAGWPYMVSDKGRVMNIRSFDVRSQFCCKPKRYKRINLLDRGRRLQVFVHRLVCEAFHGQAPSPLHQVAHWDGNPGNNRAANLRWATPKENAADRERHGHTSRGERNGARKITESLARIILASDLPHNTIANLLGVSRTQVRSIRAGKHWAHLDMRAARPCKAPR